MNLDLPNESHKSLKSWVRMRDAIYSLIPSWSCAYSYVWRNLVLLVSNNHLNTAYALRNIKINVKNHAIAWLSFMIKAN